ncbi:GGDEF domain-containing protein [Agitococcus lubricus]|uniref:diguanylate cyclase n=1 Tax=Agitococcus lubricus TaxID=1077255 RepID=A0A2T5IZA2_9GAMM|nr:GGDEF domain-containing protein [Agitococcus lubricus]PTQ89340.1 diguanylate cyclase (GGDEF)-like protein [Agitococcus lubricus]
MFTLTQSLWRRLTILQDWSNVERACIPAALVGILYLYYMLWMMVGIHIDGAGRTFNDMAILAILPIAGFIVVCSAALTGLGLYLHQRHIDSPAFLYLCALFYALSQVWGGYLVGSLTFVVGIVMTGAPLIGFLLLPRRVMWIATSTAFFTIFGINIATTEGYLSYAPLLYEPSDVNSALLWTHSQLFIATPHIIANIVLCLLVLDQWHRREEHVLHQSLTDALTNIHNRRSILDLLNTEIARSRQLNTPIAVIMLDLDYFKKINDNWGHPIGDLVLVEAAKTLKLGMRQSNEIGRFGGEEFILLLPNTGREGAFQLAERCRLALQALNIYTPQGDKVPVSASFGIATSEGASRVSSESLIRAADAALYQAKADGRNRVVLAAHTAADAPLAADIVTANNEEWHGQLKRLSAVSTHSIPTPEGKPWWQHFEGWRRRIGSIREWSPAAKIALVMGLLIHILWGGLAWLSSSLSDAQTALLLNTALTPYIVTALKIVLVIAHVLLITALLLRRCQPNAYWFQHLSLQFFSLSLLALGYVLGILYLPTGVIFTSAPLLGLILFPRQLVLGIWLSALAIILVLAYACALNILPYAPLLAGTAGKYQIYSEFWVYSNYLFYLPSLLIVLVTTDQILGRWREREEQIRTINLTDALTRIPNRRSIIERLEKELHLGTRLHTPLAIALLDLDYFKKINDTWGHATGDRVLQEAARVLKENLRTEDAIGRFGGEEFMIIMPNTQASDMHMRLERCRHGLASVDMLNDNGQLFHISASFGCCVHLANRTETVDVLIKKADDALYRAKTEGRNRVIENT